MAEAGDLEGVVFALALEEALADELFDEVADGSQGLSGHGAEIGVVLVAPSGDLVGEVSF